VSLLPRRTEWDALRVSYWIAVALLFAHIAIWPGFLDGPVTEFGDEESSFAMAIHWIPGALLAWIAVAPVVRSLLDSRGVRLSTPYPRSSDLPD
jgi:hypothetical protein